MRFISTLGFIITVLIACPSAFCDDEAAAMEAFKTGVDDFNNAKYEEAVEAFRNANELHPSWKILYNIGQCEAALKRYGLAIEAFEGYVGKGGDDIPSARRDEVISELERLRAMVGVVKINGPYNLDIFVDGVHRGKTPISTGIMVSAGVPHEFRIMDGNVEWLVQTETARGGIALTIDVPASPGSDAGSTAKQGEKKATGESPYDEDSASGLKIGGWISVGVGVAIMVPGVITGVMGIKSDEKYLDSCTPPPCDDPQKEETDSLYLKTGIFLGIGGAIAVTGAVLLIVDAVKGKKEDGGEVDVSLLPSAGPEFSGLMLQGTF